MKYYAIIVAGGSGNRMQTTIPKQFLPLSGKPVLMHTLEAFHSCSLKPQLILVLNKQQQAYWKELCQTYDFQVEHEIVDGGEQRFHSVKQGLQIIRGEGVVAIHDAVRPLVSAELILSCYLEAEKKGNCVVGLTPTDSIRKIDTEQGSIAVKRDEFALVQTPQTFHTDVLRTAYEQDYRSEFTDDASVAEYSGFKINLIEGERENIKITWPEDFEIAAILAKKGRNN